MTTPSEPQDAARDAGRLVGDALAGTVRSIGHVHLSISRRTFSAIGPVGAPVRLVHDNVARGVYATVAEAHAAVPRVSALGAAIGRGRRRRGETGDDTSTRDRALAVLGALNGLKGDALAADYPQLAFPMALRDHVNGGDVSGCRIETGSHVDGRSDGVAAAGAIGPTRAALAAAYPDASERVVVFVHGLCETDRSWWNGATKHHGEPFVSYGSMLRDDLGYTPAYVRYNTGRPIAENGQLLSELLDRVVAAWPEPIQELVLIGHSMGGLVARSACHLGEVDQRPWTRHVHHVICVGSPHLGAPLERAVDQVVPLLAQIPETEPVATLLDERSAGVKDLRHGVFTADEYHGDDPHEYIAHRSREVPFLEGVRYYFVGATITHDRHHPLGRLVGDLLVTYPSASGRNRHRSIPFELDHGVHVGGINHFDLLNHPTVYEHLRSWLGSATQ